MNAQFISNMVALKLNLLSFITFPTTQLADLIIYNINLAHFYYVTTTQLLSSPNSTSKIIIIYILYISLSLTPPPFYWLRHLSFVFMSIMSQLNSTSRDSQSFNIIIHLDSIVILSCSSDKINYSV